MTKKTERDGDMERRAARDRRGTERRKESAPVAVERRKLERRVKVPRRRQIDPTTCERDYTDEEVEFMNAMDVYKRRSGRMFPTCSEILEVLRDLGYKRNPAQAQACATAAESSAAAPLSPEGGTMRGAIDRSPELAEESTSAWEF